MGKRLRDSDDMEITTIHNDLNTLKKQMSEVILILGGSASYDYKGMRADVKELKTDVSNIKTEIEKIKREQGWLNIKLSTIPQKIVATVAFLSILLTLAQGIKSFFEKWVIQLFSVYR